MKLILACLMLLLPFVAYAKDSVILNSGARFNGMLRGATASNVYIMDESNCLASVPKVHIRKIIQNDKDVTLLVLRANKVYSEEMLAYFPIPDSLKSLLQSDVRPIADLYNANFPNQPATSVSAAAIALPLWVIAIVSVLSYSESKKKAKS